MFGFYLDFSSHRTREGGAQVHILSLGLDWENVVCQPIFALSNTLLIAIIKFKKVNLTFQKEKTLNKVIWENALL